MDVPLLHTCVAAFIHRCLLVPLLPLPLLPLHLRLSLFLFLLSAVELATYVQQGLNLEDIACT